jgi:hypothetical protein
MGWIHLISHLVDVNLTQEKYLLIWNLTASEGFTVKSMYLHYLMGTRYFCADAYARLKP